MVALNLFATKFFNLFRTIVKWLLICQLSSNIWRKLRGGGGIEDVAKFDPDLQEAEEISLVHPEGSGLFAVGKAPVYAEAKDMAAKQAFG